LGLLVPILTKTAESFCLNRKVAIILGKPLYFEYPFEVDFFNFMYLVNLTFSY